MRILNDMNELQSVLTDSGEGGMLYYVTDVADGDPPVRSQPCQRIVVSMENGPVAMIPFAVCIAHDNTVRLVNLTTCSEIQMKESLPSESAILVPGLVRPPGQPN